MEKEIIVGKHFNRRNSILVIVAITLSIPFIYYWICLAIYGDYSWKEFFHTDGGAIIPILLMPLFLVFSLLMIFFNSNITVTDKRIFGKNRIGKRVDLPLDSVSSIGYGAFHGISVATSSGNISFLFISNNKEVHKCVCDLLLERQKEKNTVIGSVKSEADELEKYKKLLDSGVITQEEFDAKKKQLLGL